MDLNKIHLIGRLTADPITRGTGKTQCVVARMATNRSWKDAHPGKVHEETVYHTVVSFGRLAEVVSAYLKKGDRLYVDGRLRITDWTAKDGHRSTRVEIVAQNVILLGGTKQGNDSVVVEEIEVENGAGV